MRTSWSRFWFELIGVCLLSMAVVVGGVIGTPVVSSHIGVTVVSHSVTQWCPHTLIHRCMEPMLIGKLSPGAAEEPRGNYREVFQVIDTVPVREAQTIF